MINYCLIIGSSGLPQYNFANEVVEISGARYESRLLGQPQWGQWLFGIGRTIGNVDMPSVTVKLNNGDHALDTLPLMATRAQDSDKRCYLFAVLDDGVTVVPCCSFIIDSITTDTGSNVVTISGKEWLSLLDRPFSTHRYAGTNAGAPLAGVEGTASDIKGKLKPHCYGQVFNLEPVCVNTTKLIYQFQDETVGLATGFTVAAYDRRSALTFNAVAYTSQADMETNAPLAGNFRVWPAGGMIRLGSALVGRLTLDVVNPVNASPPAGQTNVDCQYIIDKILTLAGVAAFYTPVQQASSGSQMNQKAGIYITEDTTYLQVLQDLLNSMVMGIWTKPANRQTSGQVYHVRRVYKASTFLLNTILTLTDDNVVKGTLRPLPCADSDRGNANVKVVVGYQKNYTVMSKSDAPSVTDAVLATVAVNNLSVNADGSFLGVFPNGPQLTLNTLLADVAAANDMRDYLGFYASYANSVGYSDIGGKDMLACEVPESVFMTMFTQASVLASGLFDSTQKIDVTGLRWGGYTAQLLSYQATGKKERTFALTMRYRRG